MNRQRSQGHEAQRRDELDPPLAPEVGCHFEGIERGQRKAEHETNGVWNEKHFHTLIMSLNGEDVTAASALSRQAAAF